ncbi:MAG: anhydro-N-acetylmuramic acid kinase [Pseudomonadota bacterium]|nr:anhydro-N-acetylmuramic acid kinase [Pseudomonadota bacterium]
MSSLYIGVMSGTSRDNLDGCIVDFTKRFKIHKTLTIPFSKYYKTSKSYDFISEEINEKTIYLVSKIIEESDFTKKDIKAIAFSGQTISHNTKSSLQAGSPEYISDKLSMEVISDFRNEDIRRGGLGAPLIPEFHNYIFGEPNKSKLIVNIGGIANGTHLIGKKVKLASDLGPGNCLMDFVMINKNLGNFDLDGNLASIGRLNNVLYKKISEPFNDLPYPRADDISIYTDKIKQIDLDAFGTEELLRTLAEITAMKINDFYLACQKPEEVFIHGGGAKNKFLMHLLESKIKKTVKTTNEYIPIEYVEAAAFAFLAHSERGVSFK